MLALPAAATICIARDAMGNTSTINARDRTAPMSAATGIVRESVAMAPARGEPMIEAGKQRVAIASTGADAEAEVDRHFSCCSQFLIVEQGGMRVLKNSARGGGSMAGPNAARLLIKNRVTAVIAGNIGPKAFRMLEEEGIAVHAGCTGRIKDALARCARDELAVSKGATFLGELV